MPGSASRNVHLAVRPSPIFGDGHASLATLLASAGTRPTVTSRTPQALADGLMASAIGGVDSQIGIATRAAYCW